MGAPDLIFRLREAGYTIKADGYFLDISPSTGLTPELVLQLKQNKYKILAALELEQQRESRQKRVVAMLEDDFSLMRAVANDINSDPDNVIVTMAIRHVGVCEILIPKENFNPWQLLALIDEIQDESAFIGESRDNIEKCQT